MHDTLDGLEKAASAQLQAIAATEPHWLAAAPGRVNLIGDHTDYSEGLALPMAIDLYTVMAASPRGPRDGEIHILSSHHGTATLQLDRPETPGGDWADYLRGVLAAYLQLGIAPPAMNIAIGGNLPMGAGLSSSASLELCFAVLIEAAGGAALARRDRALLCQRAEHDYAGVPCGILDQFAVSFATAGSAMLLDCRQQTVSNVSLPPGVAIAIVDSGVSHALVDGGYAQRRDEVRAAESQLEKSLRDANHDDIAALGDPDLRARATHVVSENTRVQAFAAALAGGDLTTAGQLMYQSHHSLANDFKVSCSELDKLVAAAEEAGALGARMTGGGFGGSMVALVVDGDQSAFESAVNRCLRNADASSGAGTIRWVTPAAAAAARSVP